MFVEEPFPKAVAWVNANCNADECAELDEYLGAVRYHLSVGVNALSNPFTTDKSLQIRLTALRQTLLQRAVHAALRPRQRPAWPRRSPVLETVTRVLESAERPMRACEIHLAACELHGGPLRWPSVKDALSAYTRGGDHRFRRLQRGVYQLARRAAPPFD